MNKIKKIISIVLAVAFVFAFPVNASCKSVNAGKTIKKATVLKKGKNVVKLTNKADSVNYLKLKIKEKGDKYRVTFSNLRGVGAKSSESLGVSCLFEVGKYPDKNATELKPLVIDGDEWTQVTIFSEASLDPSMGYLDYQVELTGDRKNDDCIITLYSYGEYNKNAVKITVEKLN